MTWRWWRILRIWPTHQLKLRDPINAPSGNQLNAVDKLTENPDYLTYWHDVTWQGITPAITCRRIWNWHIIVWSRIMYIYFDCPYLLFFRWISTHHRMKSYFDDEKVDIVLDYNLGMRNFFDSGRCGDVNYIDVFNMTASLAINQPDEVCGTFFAFLWGRMIILRYCFKFLFYFWFFPIHFLLSFPCFFFSCYFFTSFLFYFFPHFLSPIPPKTFSKHNNPVDIGGPNDLWQCSLGLWA